MSDSQPAGHKFDILAFKFGGAEISTSSVITRLGLNLSSLKGRKKK